MSIKPLPLFIAMSVAVPLHAAIFILACYPFFNIPMGSAATLVNMRTTAMVISALIIVGGSVISAFAVGALYTSSYAKRFLLTRGAGSLGTILANELARLCITIVFGCAPLTLSVQYIDYLPPNQAETYRLLLVPFFPVLLELGMLVFSIPLAALAGWLCAIVFAGTHTPSANMARG